jgi:hypothetical protein
MVKEENIMAAQDIKVKIKKNGEGVMSKVGDFIEKEKHMISQKIEEQKSSGPFTTEKLVSVSLLGALTGLVFYYTYYSLSEETRHNINQKVRTNAKKYVGEMFPMLANKL